MGGNGSRFRLNRPVETVCLQKITAGMKEIERLFDLDSEPAEFHGNGILSGQKLAEVSSGFKGDNPRMLVPQSSQFEKNATEGQGGLDEYRRPPPPNHPNICWSASEKSWGFWQGSDFVPFDDKQTVRFDQCDFWKLLVMSTWVVVQVF